MSPQKTPPSHPEPRTAAGPLPRRPPANTLEAVAPSRSCRVGDPTPPRPVRDLSPRFPGPTLRSLLQRHRENETWRAVRSMPAPMPSLKATRGRPGPELRGRSALGGCPQCFWMHGDGGGAGRRHELLQRQCGGPHTHCPSMLATPHPPTVIGAIRGCPSPDTVLWGSPFMALLPAVAK